MIPESVGITGADVDAFRESLQVSLAQAVHDGDPEPSATAEREAIRAVVGRVLERLFPRLHMDYPAPEYTDCMTTSRATDLAADGWLLIHAVPFGPDGIRYVLTRPRMPTFGHDQDDPAPPSIVL